MPFVGPRWTAHEVKNWEDLLVESANGDRSISEATASLINYMSIVNVEEITQQNAEEVWCRIAFHQSVFGSVYSNSGNPVFLTRADVLRHIGMEAEARPSTFSEFCNDTLSKLSNQKECEEKVPAYVANGNESLLAICGVCLKSYS